jgi:hypothetical protein
MVSLPAVLRLTPEWLAFTVLLEAGIVVIVQEIKESVSEAGGAVVAVRS